LAAFDGRLDGAGKRCAESAALRLQIDEGAGLLGDRQAPDNAGRDTKCFRMRRRKDSGLPRVNDADFQRSIVP